MVSIVCMIMIILGIFSHASSQGKTEAYTWHMGKCRTIKDGSDYHAMRLLENFGIFLIGIGVAGISPIIQCCVSSQLQRYLIYFLIILGMFAEWYYIYRGSYVIECNSSTGFITYEVRIFGKDMLFRYLPKIFFDISGIVGMVLLLLIPWIICKSV